MQRRLAERGIENLRIAAVDGADAAQTDRLVRSRAKSPLEAAGIASHLRAMARALADGRERFLVMEDDCTFEPYDAWPEGFAAISSELPPQFSALALCIAELPAHLDALFLRQGLVHRLGRRSWWSVGAYLMTRAGARLLLERYARGGRYDVTRFRGPQHAYEVIMRTLQAERSLPGPYLSRVPLFLFEGDDSDIHPDHLDEHRQARDYLRAHFRDLIAGTYRSPFARPALLRRLLSRLRRDD